MAVTTRTHCISPLPIPPIDLSSSGQKKHKYSRVHSARQAHSSSCASASNALNFPIVPSLTPRSFSGNEVKVLKKGRTYFAFSFQVGFNPLWQKKRKYSKDEVVKIVGNFRGQPCQKFHACWDLLQSVHFFPGKIDEISKIFIDKASPRELYCKELSHLLLTRAAVPFLSCISKYSEEWRVSLAKKIVVLPQALPAIELLTEYEISWQRVDTLFREQNLVSELCTLYLANHLSGRLESLAQKMYSAILSMKPERLMLKDKKNLICFKQFTEKFLNEIYGLPVSLECRALLKIRQDLVRKKHGEEAARSSVGELFFLRLLNPYLTNYSPIVKNLEVRHVIVDFTKIVQKLANDGSFNKSSPFASFNDTLLRLFRKRHLQFLRRYSS